MKYFYFISVLIFGFFLSFKPLNAEKICFKSEEGDSADFGFSLAMNDDYLAVGDPIANRVVIYSRQDNEKWSRSREISPPKNSQAHKVKSGFGYDIALDRNTLIIGAYVEKHKPDNKDDFLYTNYLGVSFSGGIYKKQLDRPGSIERIDKLKNGEISGYSLAAADGKVAFSIKQEKQPGIWIGKVNILSSETFKEILTPLEGAEASFAADIDLNSNHLLVGSPLDNTGTAWLFNLTNPQNNPQKIHIPNSFVGGTVAISERFAVAGVQKEGATGFTPKTIIKGIGTDSVGIIPGAGRVSLDNNLLMRVRYASPDNEQQALLEIFDLNDIAAPRLVQKREFIDRAFLYDSLLTTVQKTYFGMNLCIEKLAE